ncbi:MAG TPA: phosphopantetheine-binding protein [Steroidobacteraceae bacterium]|nr:phosphopantetheine-binding protein [Steroidobacteraceae bacterium]
MPDEAVDLERLRALFLEHFHVEVPPGADLLESGVLDSLQLVDLLLLIEQTFGRRISIESIDLDDLRTLERLAELVGRPAHTAGVVRELTRRGHHG